MAKNVIKKHSIPEEKIMSTNLLKTFYKKAKHLTIRLAAKYMQKIAGKDRAMKDVCCTPCAGISHVQQIQHPETHPLLMGSNIRRYPRIVRREVRQSSIPCWCNNRITPEIEKLTELANRLL